MIYKLRKIINIKNYTSIKILFFYIIYFFSTKKKFYKFLISNFYSSYSQIYQDLVVLYYLESKKNGSFIEIGGGDGVIISNTYLLEKKYKWKGIICEPNSRLKANIKLKRNAKHEERPITNKSYEKINFHENVDPYQSSIFNERNSSNIRTTKSISLNHLLEENKLSKVDYISIDTEGNEYDILSEFKFKKYDIKIFTIEHNYNKNKRKKIINIMKKNNYIRVHKNLSYMDDWFIKENLNE